MYPPVERHGAVTDCDSDASDDMNDGLVHHLPRRSLNSQCETNMLASNVPSSSITEEDYETESPALQKITEDLPHSSYNSSRPVRENTKIVCATNRDISSSDEDDAVDSKSPPPSPPAKKTVITENASTLPPSPSRSPPAKKTVIKKMASTLPLNWKRKTN